MKPIYQLIPENSFFALSAGVDSVACAHFLAQKGKIRGIVHSNNKFLPEDDKMEQAAKNLADYLKLPFYFERDYETFIKGSEEDFCRQKRLRFFEKWASRWEFRPTILTAHHLNDCVESFVMRTIFQGHPDYRPIPFKTEFINFTLARPFLLAEKEEMVQYCQRFNLLQFVVDDPLNLDTAKTRNWIRHNLLPQIYDRVNLKTIVRKKMISFLDRENCS